MGNIEVNNIKISIGGTQGPSGMSREEFLSLSKGGPAGVYDSIEKLNEEENIDKTRIYLTTDNGNWNYWNGERWVSGGIYLNKTIDIYKEFTFEEKDFNETNNFIIGCFIANNDNDNTDTVCTDASWAVTPYIKISPNTSIDYENCIVTLVHKSIAFYDIDGNLIETKKSDGAAREVKNFYNIKNTNAAYVRFTVNVKDSTGQKIKIKTYNTTALEYYTARDIKNKQNANIVDTYNLDNIDDTFYRGYIDIDSKTDVGNGDWRTSPYINLNGAESIDYILPYQGTTYGIVFYDKDKKLMTGVYRSWDFDFNEIFAYGHLDKEYFKNYTYVRFVFCVYDKKLNSQYVKISREHKAFSLSNTTIFLAGDSRSSTDYSFYKDTLKNKTGANIIVGGGSGWTTAAIATNAYFNRLIDNKHEFSIWLVGGNDIGNSGTVGTFSTTTENYKNGEEVVEETNILQDYNGNKFIQAVDHIMRKYKYLFYDWRVNYREQKPKMIFCTDLPQKRKGGESTWSLKENWERKNNAIRECCKKNNVACLDLYNLCNFDMEYEPEWQSPTDTINNKGLYFMDGLHPNIFGIDIITSLEYDFLKKYILINL